MKIKYFMGLLAVLPFGMFLLGCDRVSTGRSSVVIQMPTASELQKMSKSDVSALSALDLAKLCFAVNLKGPGIKMSPAKECNIERGIFTRSVKPGDVIEIQEVESGPDRVFELYAFVRTNATDVCPPSPPDGSWNWPLDKTYFLGKAEKVNIVPPETKVEILYSLPSASQNIVAQNSWPATCMANVKPVAKRVGRLVSGAALTQSTNFKAYSKISPLSDEKPLVGTNYRIRNWKVGE